MKVTSDSLQLHGLYNPWNSPGRNTGVGILFLLQGILPTQRLNPGLPHRRRILYWLNHREAKNAGVGSWYYFSSGFSWLRNQTGMSCIAGSFFTNWAIRDAHSAYKLNKQGENIQPWYTPFPVWNQSIVPCLLLTVASPPAYRFLRWQVRWSSIPISWRIFHSLL